MRIQPTPPPVPKDDGPGESLPATAPGSSNQPKDSVVAGRTDLGIIFRWLRSEPNNVRKIIKLIVEDRQPPAHSNEEIENAVQPFKVEIWDWRKVDLCGETIAVAAVEARQVNLYWSGNNAVLMGWSDREGGLARLKFLEKVLVFPESTGLEGPNRYRRNFEQFQARLKKYAQNKGKVTVELVDTAAGRPQNLHDGLPPKKDETMQNHRWLKCIEAFGRFAINAGRDPKVADRLQPITIAIIDDGIDNTDPSLHDRVIGGKPFCANDESPSFFVSSGGHGTTMARIVTRVFPAARIVSLKLDEHEQADASTQFSVQSAAEAVAHAARMTLPTGVDIVSMSWSIESAGTKPEPVGTLTEAVTLASQKKKLMFCSANDQGRTKDNSYPGECMRSALFKIGAATATGTEYGYVANMQGSTDFLFPGRVVEDEKDEETDESGGDAAVKPRDRSKEGSSIATAFAAGLAGLILHVLQLTALYYDPEDLDNARVTMEQYNSIKKDPAMMKQIFKNIGINERNFVEVWNVFDGAENFLRTGGRDPDEKFKYLSEVCSKLITGIKQV